MLATPNPNYVGDDHVCACPACSPEIDALLGGHYSARRAYEAETPEPPYPDDVAALLDHPAWDAYYAGRDRAEDAAHQRLRAQHPVSWEGGWSWPLARLFFPDGTEALFVQAIYLGVPGSEKPDDQPWYVAVSVRASDVPSGEGRGVIHTHRCRCRQDGGQHCRTLVRGEAARGLCLERLPVPERS